MLKVFLITNNKGKLLAAQSVFSSYDIELKQLVGNYSEIQADSSAEISKFTAIQVAKEKNISVIREDASIYVTCLGIPGPFMHFIEERLTAEKLLKILSHENDRNGYFEISATYAEQNGFHKTFTFRKNISFSDEPKGNFSKGWNRIIVLEGENRTLAQYEEKDRTDIWNSNYKKIAKLIVQRSHNRKHTH